MTQTNLETLARAPGRVTFLVDGHHPEIGLSGDRVLWPVERDT